MQGYLRRHRKEWVLPFLRALILTTAKNSLSDITEKKLLRQVGVDLQQISKGMAEGSVDESIYGLRDILPYSAVSILNFKHKIWSANLSEINDFWIKWLEKNLKEIPDEVWIRSRYGTFNDWVAKRALNIKPMEPQIIENNAVIVTHPLEIFNVCPAVKLGFSDVIQRAKRNSNKVFSLVKDDGKQGASFFESVSDSVALNSDTGEHMLKFDSNSELTEITSIGGNGNACHMKSLEDFANNFCNSNMPQKSRLKINIPMHAVYNYVGMFSSYSHQIEGPDGYGPSLWEAYQTIGIDLFKDFLKKELFGSNHLKVCASALIEVRLDSSFVTSFGKAGGQSIIIDYLSPPKNFVDQDGTFGCSKEPSLNIWNLFDRVNSRW